MGYFVTLEPNDRIKPAGRLVVLTPQAKPLAKGHSPGRVVAQGSLTWVVSHGSGSTVSASYAAISRGHLSYLAFVTLSTMLVLLVMPSGTRLAMVSSWKDAVTD